MSKCALVPALVLVLSSVVAPARAEETTLLERLSEESADVAARTKSAVVPLVTGARGGHGVVVGTPPLLVVPYEIAGEFKEVLLDDNSGIAAERIDGDAGLGVAVYELPEDQAARWTPLEVEREWTMRRGSFALSAGSRMALLVVKEVDPARGALRIAGSAEDVVLLSPRGRLLGLGAQPEPAHAWHRAWNPYDYPAWNPYYYPGSNVVRFYGGGLPGSGSSSSIGPIPPLSFGLGLDATAVSVPPGSWTIYGPWSPAGEPVVVPGPVIARVVEDIQEYGRIRHPYVGIVPGIESEDDGAPRIFLSAVLPDSPAAKAGLKKADVLTAIQGHATADIGTFERIVALLRPGEVLRVQVRGRDDEVKVVLGERAEARRRLVTPEDVGLEVVGLTAELNLWLGLPNDRTGVVVRNVREGSLTAQAGIAKGDVIQQAAGHMTRDAAELEAALAGAAGDVVLAVWKRSNGSLLEVTLSLPGPSVPAGAR